MIYLVRFVALSLSVASAILGVSYAEEFVCLEHDDIIASGYSEAALRPDFMSGATWAEKADATFGNNIAACSDSFCPSPCRSEGIFFSADFVFVDIWQEAGEGIASGLLALHTPAAAAIDGVDPEIDASVRYELGYLTCEGLGVQMRYWDFDNAASIISPRPQAADPNLVTQAWDVSVFDVEVVKMVSLNSIWDAAVSGGYRFASYEESASLRLNSTQLAKLDTRFIGNGVTGAIGARSQLARRLSVNADGRVSLLFGSQTVTSSVALPPNPFNSGFDDRSIIESQLAATYEHPLCGGGFWFVRGGYEAQYWHDFVIPGGTQTNSSSTVFHGLMFAVGLQR